jgi:hypothetical protein
MMRRLVAAAFVAWVVLCSPWAAAMTIAPPEAIAILFETRSHRLTREGLVAVDRLAVRAAQCPVGELTAYLQPAKAAGETLTQQRLQTVRRRLAFLGLEAKVQTKPLREWARELPMPRQGHVMLADVGTDGEGWCGQRGDTYMFLWAQALGRHVEDPSQALPSFWRRLSPRVRSDELALPLAMAAFCADPGGCGRHPELYHWLAERALRGASTERKREWLVRLWTQDEEAEVERFRKRWALAPLTVEERADHTLELAASGLPWSMIERRLIEPGLMRRYAGEPAIWAGSPGDSLLQEATRRHQLDSFDRLLDAAGPAKACLVEDALRLAANSEEDFSGWLAHVAAWARGAGHAVHATKYGPEACDPTALLMRGALCGLDPEEDALTARYQAMWQKWVNAGVTPSAETVLRLTAPAANIVCRLEPVPGLPGTFRGVPNDSRQSQP